MVDDETSSESTTIGHEERKPVGRLLNRNFVLLWQGQMVSRIGNQAFAVAMMSWTMEVTGSASIMAGLMLASSLPGIVLGPVAGTLADRVSRKWILVACDTLSGLSILGLALPFFVPNVDQQVLIYCVAAMAFILGVLQAFFQPAAMAAIPDLVPREKVAAANSLDQSSLQVSGLLGFSLSGVLYGVLGAPVLFVIDGVTYLLSALSESFISLPQTKKSAGDQPSQRTGYRQDLIEGLRYVWGNLGMRSFLFLAAMVNFFAMPMFVLLPFLVSKNLGKGPDWYGFLLAGWGFGALMGYILAGSIKLSPKPKSHVLLTALLLMGFLMGSLGSVSSTWVALGLTILIGLVIGFFNIVLVTAFQMSAKKELRGRVMGVVTTVAMAVAPLGIALGGVLGDATDKNLPLLYGLCGASIGLATLILGFRKHVRDFLAFPSGIEADS